MTAAASEPQKVAIVTGASRGIGAGLTKAFARAGYAVVATSRSIRASTDPDVLAVPGDIAEAETAQRVTEHALDRFGRIDTLINNAGVFIGKPFTDYTRDDYAALTAVNLDGFSTSHSAPSARLPHERWTGRGYALAGHRICVTRRPRQRGLARSDQDADARPRFI